MDADVVIAHQTVLVDGERITRIGPADEAALPVGTRRIAGRGRFLMPGLADMHCHPTAEMDLLLCLAYGVTTVRNMWGMPRHLRWQAEVADGALLGPDVHTSGPIVEGGSVRNRWTLSARTPTEGTRAVHVTRDGGYPAVKVYDELTPAVYDAVVAAAADQQLPVVGHVPYLVGLDAALAAGQRSIEHLYGYLDALRPQGRPIAPPKDLADMRAMLFAAASAASVELLPAVAEATRNAGTWNCPTLLLRRRWQQQPAALARQPGMRYQSPLLAERRRVFAANHPRDPNVDRVCELNLAVVKALGEAEAGLLTGTDAGLPTIVFGAALHEELHAFCEAGLSPYQALRASTADAAAFLGEDDEWGTVRAGCRADLLLVDANPLLDVANAARIVGVMKRGRWLTAADLEARLDELAAERTAPRQQPVRNSHRQSGPPGRCVAYEVTWSGHPVGVEVLDVEIAPGDGRRHSWNSEIEMFDWCPLVGAEAGRYRTEIDVDAAGLEQAARLTYDGPDGHRHVELTRDDGRVRIVEVDPAGSVAERFVDACSDRVLFGNYLTALYARLAARLRTLDAGERAELELLGPGLAPDFVVATSSISAECLPGAAADGPGMARYAFQITRHNAGFSGVLTSDRAGLLATVQLDAAPALIVRRVR